MSSDVTTEEVVGEVQDTESSFEGVGTESFAGSPEPVVEPTETFTGEVDQGQPEPYYPTLSDQISNLGFTDVQSEADAQSRLLQGYQQLQDQNQQWADYYQQNQQYAQQNEQLIDSGRQYNDLVSSQQWQEYQAYQQQQPAAEETIATPSHWWSPPEVDFQNLERWREQKVDAATGEIYTDWKEGAPVALRNASQEYVHYMEDWAEKIIRRPQEVLPQVIEQEFDRLFQDRYGKVVEDAVGRQQEVEKQYNVEDIMTRNADWLYEKDPRTNQLLADANGQQVMTQQGRAVTNYVNYFRNVGIEDPNTLWTLATRMYAGDLAATELSQSNDVAQAQQQNYQRNVEHYQQQTQPAPQATAGYIAPAGGSVPTSDQLGSQNQHLSAGDKLRQQAFADGMF